MPACRICGKSAGWFRDVHEECVRERAAADKAAAARSAAEAAAARAAEAAAAEAARREKASLREIANAAKEAARGQIPAADVAREIEIARTQLGLAPEKRREFAMSAWILATEEAMEDGLLTAEEEKRMIELGETLGFKLEEVNKTPAYWHLVQGAVLRDVMEKRWPSRVEIDPATLPFNLQKKERLAWIFKEAEYFKMTTRYLAISRRVETHTETAGGYHSVGEFVGESIPVSDHTRVGTGVLGVTQKHLYFAGPQKSLRVPFSKIISFDRFEDGIGFHRDTASALPEYFKTGDGWFVYNLVTNIQHLE